MSKVAIMGSGSWGTALGMVMADAGGDVALWAREAEVVESINTQHVNERYHPAWTCRSTCGPVPIPKR